ncbi:MAG: hypothetical protein O2798_03080 [Chloroflexi bacterium]|nr:hypothetical protein [Chloroflexota bacterium]
MSARQWGQRIWSMSEARPQLGQSFIVRASESFTLALTIWPPQPEQLCARVFYHGRHAWATGYRGTRNLFYWPPAMTA